MNPQKNRRSGFTLVEMAIALGILVLLMASVFSITGETSKFLSDNDTETLVQLEGSRAFQRLIDLLRKSGRVTAGGVAYPRVTSGGAALEFRVLADLDGNGYAFDQDDGSLEWHPAVFTIKADASGNLDVTNGAGKVYALGRHIQNLNFQTIAENPALHFKEIQVSYEVRKTNGAGIEFVYPVSASVHMRN
ncbi:MAG: prepilin-type N-terminal cleavage/methylation domain-containing protein [Planctomycetes bacterium]|nr:prepilin-type N-terminal cleavage/methylation domain-containing protein [Planctomycetota bacterium]